MLNRDYFYTGNTDEFAASVIRDKAAGVRPSGKIEAQGLAYRQRKFLHVHAINTVSKAAKNILLREPTEEEIGKLYSSIFEYTRQHGPREAVAEAFVDV